MADSGRVVSDAGGGAEKAPATITWKNDNGSPVPTHTGLESHTKETAENLRKDNPQMNSLNVNSGKRDGAGPHADGRAVDINRINGVKAGDLADPKTPEPDCGGKAERFMQTARRKWAYAASHSNSNERASELPRWLHECNFYGDHPALRNRPPICRSEMGVDNVLQLHS